MVMEDQERLDVAEAEGVRVGEVKNVTNQQHKFETGISISNQTENITLEITIRNMAGSVQKILSIMIPVTTTPYVLPFHTMEQFQATSSTTGIDMSNSFIVGILALLSFTVFMVLTTIMLVRYTRRGRESKDIDTGEYNMMTS